jgi:hypothetical protein
MRINDTIFRNLPNPEMEGHDRRLQVFLQSTMGGHQHFLNHVTNVNTLANFPIQPHLDKSPHRVTMSV